MSSAYIIKQLQHNLAQLPFGFICLWSSLSAFLPNYNQVILVEMNPLSVFLSVYVTWCVIYIESSQLHCINGSIHDHVLLDTWKNSQQTHDIGETRQSNQSTSLSCVNKLNVFTNSLYRHFNMTFITTML